jgi:hypothetical protein
MIPKEKAKELVESFFDALTVKDCALIAVNQLLDVISENTIEPFVFDIDYWQEVKQEIEKL